MQNNAKFAENLLQLLSQKIVILNRKINLIELDSIRRKICKILLDNYKKNNTYSYSGVLESNGIEYKELILDLKEAVDGVTCANMLGLDLDSTFKTLVTVGKSKNY